MDYDSAAETRLHMITVQGYAHALINAIQHAAVLHDASKLQDPEKAAFDKYTPMLKTLEYGSDEYKACLADMKATALDHHYAANRHHPEHFEDGVAGMTLVDVIEMVCDWMAAVSRMKNGDIDQSVAYNQKRFNMSDDLTRIIQNTVDVYFKGAADAGAGKPER